MGGFQFAVDGFAHTLAVLLLISRLSDVISTRLITPRLRLEANPIVRRLGWPFAAATLLIALIPYINAPLGVTLLAGSLLVSASNLSRGWIAHALGEDEYYAVVLRAARAGRRGAALGFVLCSAAFLALAGAVLMWLSANPSAWGYWFGMGIIAYGLVLALHGSGFVVRVFRAARATAPSA